MASQRFLFTFFLITPTQYNTAALPFDLVLEVNAPNTEAPRFRWMKSANIAQFANNR